MKSKLWMLAALLMASLGAAEFAVAPENAEIVVDPASGGVALGAAKDLQKHLKMITGVQIPLVKKGTAGKYLFNFPKAEKLKPEEAKWEVTEKGTTFLGDDEPLPHRNRNVFKSRRTGTIYAVSDFLERQLGVRFMEPGDRGTFFVPAKKINLKTGSNSWDPGRLFKREIRPDFEMAGYMGEKTYIEGFPVELKMTRDAYALRNGECREWYKHQRLGCSQSFSYGHAFTQWWKMYGKEHPEYFALYKGKRYPWNPRRPDIIKMCPSCEGLSDQIVENWKKTRPRFINVCENDWGCFCECENCRKLDVTPKGEKWEDHLSDRYFHFANTVLRKVRKLDPGVRVCIYAYSCYKEPPMRERVDSGIIIGFVPSMMNLELADKMYKGWRARGADLMFLRPNDQHVNCGLPMGQEKQMWQGFQLGVKNGIIGTDYDSCHGFWAATGVADYILARAHSYPQASFEELFDHYCKGYGSMAQEIKEYYTYWRENIWEKRIYPKREEIGRLGRFGNLRRGLMWNLSSHYSMKDFEITGKILDRAEAKAKTTVEKQRIAWLKLNHQHFILIFKAISAPGDKKLKAAKELLAFRVANQDKLNTNLMRQTTIEIGFGDVTGTGVASRVKKYSDAISLRLPWQFAMDPEAKGKTEHWEKWGWGDYCKKWQAIYTDQPWENQSRKYVPEELKKKLKNYDGIGWYALSVNVPKEWKGKEISLFFGAVDESAEIYVNGQLCGVRKHINVDDWKTAFAIPITKAIDWTKKGQMVVVRVEDRGGNGGIWRPVMLVVK